MFPFDSRLGLVVYHINEHLFLQNIKGKLKSEKSYSKEYEGELKLLTEKNKTLRDLDLFVLDNSIRESTVGQLRGHTIENKWKIYDEVKKCGFNNYIVGSFNHMTRVDDVFIRQLVERGENLDELWAFSEITDSKAFCSFSSRLRLKT